MKYSRGTESNVVELNDKATEKRLHIETEGGIINVRNVIDKNGNIGIRIDIIAEDELNNGWTIVDDNLNPVAKGQHYCVFVRKNEAIKKLVNEIDNI